VNALKWLQIAFEATDAFAFLELSFRIICYPYGFSFYVGQPVRAILFLFRFEFRPVLVRARSLGSLLSIADMAKSKL
jgi:hypothetical protein